MSWQPKVFSFQKQFKKGVKGEDFFVECYKDINARRGDGKIIDLLVNENDSVELKSDSYSMERTENFFIERYGNYQKLKDGSIWRSSLDKIRYFVYCYAPDKKFYWFNVEDFKKYMDDNLHKFEQREIKNPGYTSLGFLVPRETVKELIIREDKF